MKIWALFAIANSVLSTVIPERFTQEQWAILQKFEEEVKVQAAIRARTRELTPYWLDLNREKMAKKRSINLDDLEHESISKPYEAWKKQFFRNLNSNSHGGAVNGEGSVQPFD